MMRCWDAAEAAAPWNTRVLYTLPIHALEIEPPWSDGVRVVVETNDGAEIVNTYVFQEFSRTIGGAHISVRNFDPRKVYIRPGSHHQDVEMQQYKRFTFRSSFTWQYECVVSYKDPFVSPDGKTMAFCNPPFYQVSLKCVSLNDHKRDAAYLKQSLLAKLRDVGVGV